MSSSPENRPGPDEVDAEAVALYDALALVAGTSGSTTLRFVDVVADGGAAEVFRRPDGGIDEDRVESVAASLLADGFLARRGAAGIAPVRRPGSAAPSWQRPGLSASDPELEPVEDDDLIDEDEVDGEPEPARSAPPARPAPKPRPTPAPRAKAATKAAGRPARATTTKGKGSSAVKTTGRSTAKPVARKATKSTATRAGAPTADALAGGLASLLGQVDEQVGAVTALSTRIDDLVTELNAARAEQAARWAALAQLREVAYDAGLGEVLDPRLAAPLPSVEEDPHEPLG